MDPNQNNSNSPTSPTPPASPQEAPIQTPPTQSSTTPLQNPQSTPAQSAPPTPTPTQKRGTSKIAKIIILVLVLICLIAGGIIAYNTFIKSEEAAAKKSPTQMTAATPTPFDENGTPSPMASQQEVQSSIVTALNSKNYNSLIPYMAESVQFEVESSEAIPAGTPEDAVEQLVYLNTAAVPWDFDQENEIIMDVKAQNADEYGPLYVGISSNDVLAAFGFDENGMINVIKAAVNYKLLVAE